jgi:peptidoglycan/xylan/chitin deacetylase (PgdA/CDA1 family)
MIRKIPVEKRELYITFDDGPFPGITERVLVLLEEFNAKATFFCLGEQVMTHPSLYQQILDKGHRTGNHSWDHPNGWTSSANTYINNVRKAKELIHSDLFRPPYGRIGPFQYLKLKKEFRIVGWTKMARDYQAEMDVDTEFHRLKNRKPGDIVVFHTNHKSSEKGLLLLKRLLESWKGQFEFCSIL